MQIKDAGAPLRHGPSVRDNDFIEKIERFRFRRGPVTAEWRNKGYTLIHAHTGRPIARLRPYGRDDLMEILYWSSWRERWAAVGPFGSTIVPLNDALHIIAAEPIFWVGV
jgi:hypothetical protein